MPTLTLPITDFALPAPRVGSLETHSGYGPTPNWGLELHALIQAERMQENPSYQCEKWIGHTFERGEYKIAVGGRMDCFLHGMPSEIEEIKSAFDLEGLIDALERYPFHPYRLQLMTYGYLHWLNTGEEAELRLHLISARTRQRQDLPVPWQRQVYEEWLSRRLDEVVAEAEMFKGLVKRRKNVAKDFVFPFPHPRPGQLELMETVEKGLTGRSRLLLQAPTGLGKTAGVLYPTLKEALARGQKVLYLTPKNSQHAVGEDAARRLQAAGCKVKSQTINAKAKMCFKNEPICNPKHCEYARDYYSKVSDNKLIEKIARKKTLTAKTFRKIGEEYEVCPFELQMDSVARADLVICDYNYVFSPRNVATRLSYNGSQKKGSPNIIVDEAHNLPARANSYFSAELSTRSYNDVRFQLLDLPAEVRTLALNLLEECRQTIEGSVVLQQPGPQRVTLNLETFRGQEAKIQDLLVRYLAENTELQKGDPILVMANSWSEFVQLLELALEKQHESVVLDDAEENFSSRFYTTCTPYHDGVSLKILCCDASDWLRERYADFDHVVAFSATVKPFDYYTSLLGFAQADLTTAEFTSPFPSANRKLLVIPQVSTKYRDRAQNYGKIHEAIERIVRIRLGNYFIFFPSFDFLFQLQSRLKLPEYEILCQHRDMSKRQIQDYMEKLKRPDQPTLILAVQGGVFAEGVDYPGDMLIGAIVVGPGLPSFDFERELLRHYYDQKNQGQGFDYAYTYPAMAKVVQSAGRVIRSQTDRGLIVLMDRRFTHKQYIESMPMDWQSESVISNQLVQDIREFWECDETPPE